MPRYLCLGDVPHKRHIQFRDSAGALYAEQVFGSKGFSGISSILYHQNLPTSVAAFEPVGPIAIPLAGELTLNHLHLKTFQATRLGDTITGRRPLLVNADVCVSICHPATMAPYLYKNAEGDELLFVHEGTGTLETMFGPVAFAPGDYLVVPRGTIYRIEAEPQRLKMLVIESATPIEIPRRYRNEYGQLLEHAPYCERDIRVPERLDTRSESGRHEVRIKARGTMTAYYYDFHPFDIVGWDGYLYPWALNIGDFAPITGLIHQPPPTHQTFEAHNFVVCSFVPRMLDYHPMAVPIPYNHSNLDSDEMLYYVNGSFASRRGIEIGSITLHPSGLPHGPQPGAVEASLGHTRTEELAVMVDTFRPLHPTVECESLADAAYPFSWQLNR